MKYSGIKTDDKLRFLKCPVCGNDEFLPDTTFCRICGSALYNFCQDLYDESDYKVSSGCGKANSGNSRYCEYCGNPTLLNKFLVFWEDEKVHSQKYGEEEEACDFKPSDTERLIKKKDEFNEDLSGTFDDIVDEEKK